MNRRIVSIIAVLAVVVAGLGFYGWWSHDLRWRPHTLTRHRARIEALLDQSGWVSPGISKDKAIYLIGFRSCPDCIRFETEQFPRLAAAGVDTRVILFPRRANSTAPERAGVAELWANRSWAAYQRWMAVTPAAWTADGLPSGDTDPQRAALVEKSRRLVDALGPLLADNGVKMAFPTLIWRDRQGALRSCACERRETYRFVRRELGAT